MAITSINLGKIKFNWRGAWTLGADYVKDDVVRYNGSSYVVITGHTSATSWATNSSKFELMAEGTTPTTTEGDIIVRGATSDERLAIGDSGQVLTVESGNPVWKDNGVLDKIYYVAPTGNDTNSGQSWGTAFATIEQACSVAVGPATIYVASGQYEEQLPIVVPSFVAVVGDNQRTTIVGPAAGYEQQVMWKLGDGALLNKMAFIGLTGFIPYGPDDQNIPLATVGGVYVAFDELTPIVTKSPYVIECSAKSSGAIGALIDGSVHATGIKSMVFHGFTVILDNGVGFWVKDNGKSEIVSCFTYYCHAGYVSTGGGKIRALNGNNSYGTYGALASGYNLGEATLDGTLYGDQLAYASIAGGSFSVGNTITGVTSGATGTVVNVQAATNKLYYKLTSTGTPFQVGETFGNGSGVTAEVDVDGVSGQKGFVLIVTGLTEEPKPGGSIEIDGDTFTYVIQTVSGWTSSASNTILVLAGEKSADSVDGTDVTIRYDYSNIRLTGHDFLSIGTGGIVTTNYPNAPLQDPAQGNEVIEDFPARVFYVSTDQDGNFRVGEYFKVDQATGRATLNASAFDLSGLTSLRLGSIGAQLGELVNEFSADETLSGNSNEAVPTEYAVKQYFLQISSNVVPSVTNAYTLGTSSKFYDKIYVNKVIGPSTLIIDPAAEGNDTGTVQIKGNLQVDGTTTTINSTTLTVDDKNIILGSGAINDAAADGSGITIESADGNKTFNWVDATDSWTLSEHFDIATGKYYKIDTAEVLRKNKLTLNGSSSGTVALQAAAAAGSTTYTLPSADGSSGQALVTNGSGTLSWATNSVTIADDTSTTALYPTMTTATSGSITSAKVTSTKFSFNASTGVLGVKGSIAIQGSSSGAVTFTAPATAGSVTYTLPSADGTSGYALVTNGSGTLSWSLAGANITDDTSTTTLYPVFSATTSGSLTAAKVSSTKFSFNASTGKGTITSLLVGDSNATGALVVGSANSYAGGLVLGKANTYSGYISTTDNLYIKPNTTGNTASGSMYIQNVSGTSQFTFDTSTGNFTAAGTLTSNSDARLKTNVETITDALNKVLLLRGVMFDRISTGAHEMGTIAQEVEAVIPELVFTDAEGIKSVAYANTVALLIEAIKEQQVQIEELKKKIV